MIRPAVDEAREGAREIVSGEVARDWGRGMLRGLIARSFGFGVEQSRAVGEHTLLTTFEMLKLRFRGAGAGKLGSSERKDS